MISFFIPIRKGSKRVINKNFRPLPGYSYGLLEIKIKQLIKFKKLAKKELKNKFEFIISTNCEKTLKFLKKYKKEFRVHIRTDQDSADDSLDRLIKLIPSICKGKYILWTHVTSPLFNEKNYYEFIKSFLKSKKYKSAFSANKLQKFLYSKKKGWISHNYKKKKWPRTQDLDPIYVANSAAFIAHKNIYKYQNDRIDNKPLPINTSLSSSIDIDDYSDFLKLKFKLKKSAK